MMREEQPKVSVIIPIYNTEKYLSECLDSVCNQTLKDIEIICVNDGSTDSSQMIIEEYQSKDKRIISFQQENRGVSATRNKGFSFVKGKYIYFLDSDDKIEPETLETLFQVATKDELDVVLFDATVIFENEELKKEKSNYISYYQRKGNYNKIISGPEMIRVMQERYEYRVNVALMLIRREFLCYNHILFLEGIIHEDNLFTFQCMLHAKATIHVKRNFYIRRVRGNSIMSSKVSEENLKGYIICLNHMIIESEKHKLSPKQSLQIERIMIGIWNEIKRLHHKLSESELDHLLEEKNIGYRTLFRMYLEVFSSNLYLPESDVVKVSVIIPVYNAQKYLWDCLDSVSNQTLKEIEIICVDDGSTDRSWDILKQYESQNSRVRIYHQENKYAGVARNFGMEQAVGEYIFFLDADDFIDVTLLEELYLKAKKETAELVLFPVDTYHDDTHLFSPRPWMLMQEFLPKREVFSWEDVPKRIFNLTSPASCNKLYRRSMLQDRRLKFSERARSEDVGFVLSALAFAKRICVLHQEHPGYHYRKGVLSSLESSKNDTAFEFLEEYIDTKNILDKNGIYNKLETSFCNRVASSSLYQLDTYNSYDAYCILFNKLKNEIFPFFHIEDYSVEDFAIKGDYFKVQEIMSGKVLVEKDWQQRRKANKVIREKLNINLKEPKISIVMPVYNAERYLWECLDSLQKQTMENFELICVDDGSTDSSREILDEYTLKDNRIKVITQENRFAGVARNNGLKIARGKYIIFLDADDFFEPNMLEKAYRRIKATDADICVFKAYAFMQDEKKFYEMPWTCRKELCPKTDVFSITTNPRYIFRFTTPAPWTKLYRKSFLEENELRFQEIHSSNDASFVLTSLAAAHKITLVDEYLLSYRKNVKTTLQANRDKEPLLFLEALRELKAQLVKRNLYEQAKGAYVNFVLSFCEYNKKAIQDEKALYELYCYLRGEGKEYFDLSDIRKEDIFEKYLFEEWNKISTLSWEDYSKQRKIDNLKNGKKHIPRNSNKLEGFYRRELELVTQSASYRIGRFITFLPRKVRGVWRCYQEHGMRYTLGQIKYKFKSLLER